MTKFAIQVGVHEAKTRLSELLRAVAGGQEVDILRSGKPVAKIVPFAPRGVREIGFDEGRFTVPDDFDAPLPDDIEDSFYR
ncbi:type II toxin-antitoxin system Phd/YefM family antitoxin [Protofrankia symbiont of Coriaria ruscifolia]|uniref:type II toxin-antitoxin system Phd/YefM family antitoxin n=1 Tax=Protofrankia symbiont of Coriaria ruscifolia TaxID=1306542 RepID=UPI001041A8BF|nr:type II toxin-antitoxin system Phd/YefM family antitoxin [Protofrankia symbiont of Coriaria ruscifolia]